MSLPYCQAVRDELDALIDRWMDDAKVGTLFIDKKVPVPLFKNHFGRRIVEHHLALIETPEARRDCPAMDAALRFFRHASFLPEELYILCAPLKREMMRVLLADARHHDLYDRLHGILDDTLTTMLRELRLYHPAPSGLTCSKARECPDRQIEYRLDRMSETFDFEELEEYEDRLYAMIGASEALGTSFYNTLSALIHRYARMLIEEPHLYELSTAFEGLAIALEQRCGKEVDSSAFRTYFGAFLDELSRWRRQLIDGSLTHDTNGLTKNLMAQLQFIREQFVPAEEEEDEGELEFF